MPIFGWIRSWLSAPRRLRELRETYERDRYAWRADRTLWRKEVAQANERAKRAEKFARDRREELARQKDLEREAERLRKLNGQTYREYVVAMNERDEARRRLEQPRQCQSCQRKQTNNYEVGF